MQRRSYLHLTVPAALSALALLSACGGPEGDTLGSQQSALSSSRNHVMKMTTPGPIAESKPTGQATNAHNLTYYGGPVLTHVNVIPVYWNSNVAYQSNLNSFYSAITASSIYTSLLPQYSSIGAGTRGTPVIDTQGTGSLTDAQIQAELTNLFNAGKLPLPNANNYYPVHFPSGVNITASDGSASCVVWCAYHGTYVYNGVNVNYGVIPDQGGSCFGGCGTNSQVVNDLTSVSSHELVEATTDPAVGLATTYAPPLAWYNATYGEIGDICNGQQATITGVGVVQKEWSNSKAACTTN